MSHPILEIAGVTKNYSGLRPLRLQSLKLDAGERVAIGGLDAPAAELLVNLVTGASVPDEGEIRVFGRRTTDVTDGNEWLSSLDRFGIVSERAVLLEGATLAQNLALPLTLDIDPVRPEVLGRVKTLAAECGFRPAWLDMRAGDAPPQARARAHLARAVALGPVLLLLEHPTAALPEADRRPFASDVVRVCDARSLAALAITLDQTFATAMAHRALMLQAANGGFKAWRRWL
jgi:ABC-type transporter Mla maintaining outer membrane lipid asymmetry ATPase subunit MlaF